MLKFAWFFVAFQDMDVPSTFRVQPTASNRRRRLRVVTDDLSESDEEVDVEVVEDHPQAQEQP